MLCYGTRIIYHTKEGKYCEIVIIKNYKEIMKRYKKKVIFSDEISVYQVPSKYDEDRSIGFEIPRGLKYKWKESQETILKEINNRIDNKIFNQLCNFNKSDNNDYDQPLKITSKCQKGWWEDRSPIDMLDDILSNKIDINDLAKVIDNLINKTSSFKHIELEYSNYIIMLQQTNIYNKN